MSRRFAIASLDEARAYLAHPVLGRACASVPGSCSPPGGDSRGHPRAIDAMKLRSCMTLFHRAAPDEPVFAAVLERYYDGVADAATDARLG